MQALSKVDLQEMSMIIAIFIFHIVNVIDVISSDSLYKESQIKVCLPPCFKREKRRYSMIFDGCFGNQFRIKRVHIEIDRERSRARV